MEYQTQPLSKAKLGIFSQLHVKKQREKYRLFMVQGLKSVLDCLGEFEVEYILILKGSNVTENHPELTECPLLIATEAELKKISTLDCLPEIIGIFRIPERRKELPTLRPDEVVIALDNVQDPGNIGTIIRTAHWFGIKKIFCSHGTVDIFNPKVVQSTMGSLGRVDVIYCDLQELFEKNAKIPVYGLLLDGEDIYKRKHFTPGIILMGNEGNGISKELYPFITDRLTIPPASSDHPDSLNVAIATALTVSYIITHIDG